MIEGLAGPASFEEWWVSLPEWVLFGVFPAVVLVWLVVYWHIGWMQVAESDAEDTGHISQSVTVEPAEGDGE